MSINLQGHILNQRQLDAIVPVMNHLMQGKVSKKKFEAACVAALEAAGCALGYDTGIPGAEKSVAERAAAWILNGRVGQSSRAIYCHMIGAVDKYGYNYPSDPDDLNRCLLLLDLIPEWAPRMAEMSVHGNVWAALAGRWGELTELFLEEVGLNWSKGHDLSATKTYALMKQLQGRT